VLSGC